MRKCRPALMLGSLYVALKEAGVEDELAKRAAEEAAECLRPRTTQVKIARLDAIHLMGALNIVLAGTLLWLMLKPS